MSIHLFFYITFHLYLSFFVQVFLIFHLLILLYFPRHLCTHPTCLFYHKSLNRTLYHFLYSLVIFLSFVARTNCVNISVYFFKYFVFSDFLFAFSSFGLAILILRPAILSIFLPLHQLFLAFIDLDRYTNMTKRKIQKYALK